MHDNILVKICMLVVILFGGFCVYWKLIKFNRKQKNNWKCTIYMYLSLFNYLIFTFLCDNTTNRFCRFQKTQMTYWWGASKSIL